MPNTAKKAASDQIAAGYKLIDRYQFNQPFATDLAGAEAWHAVDFALDRQVSVLLLAGPNAEAGAEAARRAALLTDSRLTKIIDVGSIEVGGQTRYYIVTEPVAGPTLEELVSELPLDPASTRSIIGELANALDEADQRGLHHVSLRPAAVRVNNGRVMLTGLGIDAELGAVNPELGDSETQDAVGLAALAYYSLTGYWPLPVPAGQWRRAGVPELKPAPRTETGDIVPLRELAPGADPVLFELTERAFGSGTGSATGSGSGSASGSAGDGARHQLALRAPHAVAAQLSPWVPLAVDPNPVPATGFGPGFGAGLAAGAGSGFAGAVGGTMSGAIPQVNVAGTGRKSVLPGGGHPGAGTRPGTRPKTGRIPRASQGPRTSKQPVSVLPDEEPLHIRPTEVLDQAIAGQPINVAPVYRQPKPPKPHGVRATPIVLGIMLAGLISSGAWAVHNVVSPFFTEPSTAHTIEPEPPEYTAAPGFDPAGNPASLAPVEPPAEVHPVVVSGTVIDPYGDGERSVNANAVTDGDPSTFWYTYTYATPQFGGLKPGVGFFIELEQTAPVSSITFYANGGGGQVEIRQTTPDDPSGGQLLGTAEFGTETTYSFGGNVELDSIMLWITNLPQLPDGRYRLELREVTLR